MVPAIVGRFGLVLSKALADVVHSCDGQESRDLQRDVQVDYDH